MTTRDTIGIDVAFSFLARDEALAKQFADAFSGRLTTFVYSDRQLELVGNDGLVELSEVFRRRGRFVVVLHREGWGDTPWTAVEVEAIKARGFDNGSWTDVLLIALDSARPPSWFPPQRIWFNLERFGFQAGAAIIEARFIDAGGTIRNESIVDRAVRIADETRRRAAREQWIKSPEGFAHAKVQTLQIIAHVKEHVAAIVERAPTLGLFIQERTYPTARVAVRAAARGACTVTWS